MYNAYIHTHTHIHCTVYVLCVYLSVYIIAIRYMKMSGYFAKHLTRRFDSLLPYWRVH